MSEWQPIETAPKSQADGREVDGVYLLGFTRTEIDEADGVSPEACIDVIWWEPLLPNKAGTRGRWTANRFGEAMEVEATHWMPLPAPPNNK